MAAVTLEADEISEVLSGDVAVLILNTDGLGWDIVFVRRRPDATHGGKLAFAGGRKEAKDGGKIKRTARRELWEEMRIWARLNQLRLVDILDGHGRDPRPGGRTSVVYVFVAKETDLVGMRPEPGAEIVRMPLVRVKRKMMAFDHYSTVQVLRHWRYA